MESNDIRQVTEADENFPEHARTQITQDDGSMEIEIGNISNVAPEPTVDPAKVSPFASEQEMAEAQDARDANGNLRMETDAEYAALVEARTVASMGPSDTWFTGFDSNAKERREAEKRAARQAKALRGKQSLKIGDTTGQEQARGFESEAELEQAIGDERYRISPSYRRKVDARLAVTDMANLGI